MRKAKKATPNDPVLNALKRSAKKAYELAIATGTGCLVMVDGKIVDLTKKRRKVKAK